MQESLFHIDYFSADMFGAKFEFCNLETPEYGRFLS